MKITLEIPDQHIDSALERPHSRYWASEGYWDPETRKGWVIERFSGARHVFGSSKVKLALEALARDHTATLGRIMAGLSDGPDGDLLLQLAALGELRY